MPRPQLSAQQRIHLPRLLDMWYSALEIAQELGVHKRTVTRHWIRWGCPYVRDEQNRIWISGYALREWLGATTSYRKLADDEALCLASQCRCPRKIISARKTVRDGVPLLSGQCAICHGHVYRFLSHKVTSTNEGLDDQSQ